MLGPLDALKDIVKKFEDSNMNYILVGSLASMYYGQPRFTNDIDLVVEIHPSQTKQILSHFTYPEYYCPPEEILRDEVLRKGFFNLIHQESMMKIDIDVAKETEFYTSELQRKKRVSITSELQVYIASPEDIIIKKLDYYRMEGSEKHISDIRGMVAETILDQNYLNYWITKFGLTSEWAKI